MCPKSAFCRLCLCSSTEVKELINENGQYNNVYEITAKYFDPMLLTTVICVDCWQHIFEFYEFQQSVLKAQANLEGSEQNEPLVKMEMVLLDQDENVEIKELKGDDKSSLFDSVDLSDYNPFISDAEVPLAEYSTQNISIINCKEETIYPVSYDTLNQDEYKFKCTLCDKSFKLARNLRQHTTTHTGQALYQCPLCSTKCTLYKNIRRHIQKLHPKEFVDLGYNQQNVLTKLYSTLKEESIQPNYDDDDKGKFKCPYCRSKVSHQRNLPRHIKALHPEKYDEYLVEIQNLKLKQESDNDADDMHKFKCPHCQRKFLQKKNIRRHIRLLHPDIYVEPTIDTARVDLNLLGNHGEKSETIDEDLPNYDDYDAFIAKWKEDLECYLCKKTFINFGLLRKHFKDEHPNNKCYIKCCEYKIPSRIRLVDHIRFHLDRTSFKCDVCGKCLGNSISLHIHMRSHSEKIRYECNVCGKGFRKNYKLLLHAGIHSTEMNYFCNVCGKGFSIEPLLKKHEYIHTRNAKYLCDQCGKYCHSSIELEKHILQHTDIENPDSKWPCDICGALFTSRSTFRFHKKSCHSDTVYVCSECGKKFSNILYLKLHKKFHRRKGKFKCAKCNKEVMSAKSLHEHEATHSGYAKYQCPHCPLKLKQKKNIPRHIQIAHPLEFNQLTKRKRTKVDLSLLDNQMVI